MNQKLELFWISGSPFAWRVQLALAIHHVDYVSHLLDAAKGELKQAEYLALNPRGKVPLLKHGELLIRESVAILVYLDSLNPKWQIFGATSQDKAIIWQQICEVENIIVPYLRQFVRPIFFGGLEDKKLEVIEAARQLNDEFTLLNGFLADRSWLAGDQLSAADIVTYPLLKFVERAANKEQAKELNLDLLPFAEKYPNLEKWLQKIEEIPGVRDTYPPYWR
ncbi:MAG: glutathione S-transferase family protein [Xenococcaceae cyanobacterium MO_188.B29]|nr:glutathione S-transferase family protein [Xenococcaceae cyanobacterium MO_188.B29]